MNVAPRRTSRPRRFALAACLVGGLSLAASSPASAVNAFDVVATINVTFSSQVAASDQYAFVASNSQISVIDATSNTVVRTVSTSGTTSPQDGVVVGNKVYFANSGSNNLTILNTTTWNVSYLATTGCASPTLLLPLSSTSMVVDCRSSNRIQVINPVTDTIVQTVAVGGTPRGMSANGSVVFVPNSSANSVSIVDTSVNPATVTTVAVGSQPEWTAYLSGKIYAANFNGNSVSILNGTAPYSVITTVAVGNNPQGIDPCAGNIFTANRWTGNTSVISPTSNSVTNTIALATTGAITHVMGVNGTYAFFLNFDRSTVSIVDCVAQTLSATVPSASNPASIAFSRNNAYVAGNNQLTAIALASSSGGNSSSTTPGPTTYEFSLATADGTRCSSSSQIGVSGTWMPLPAATDCTPPASMPNAQLLGWATTPDFPVAIAMRQVQNGWGAYEIFNSEGRMTGVFIPAGGSTLVSAANSLHPIWSK